MIKSMSSYQIAPGAILAIVVPTTEGFNQQVANAKIKENAS
jgi:hypothetical protein